MLEVS